MLACLKSNDFDEKPCSQVVDTFNKCVVAAEVGSLNLIAHAILGSTNTK